MSYKYETHLHTSTSSKCGRSKGAEYVPYYKALGYDGIFVTDHFYLGNTCVPRELPWEEWVHRYCDAYRETKAAGDAIGLKVFFGWETSYAGEDFLIYGLDEEWLLEHPDIRYWDQKEQYEHVQADGGLVVQAHPFRERNYQTEVKIHPHHSDAWEVANCGNKPYQDILAYTYAKEHGIIMTAGSDIHKAGGSDNGCLFGMITEEPLNSAADYVKLVKSGTGYQLNVAEGWHANNPQNPWFDVFLYNEAHERVQLPGIFFPGAPIAVDPH